MKLLVVTPTLGESPWLDACVASVAACAGEHEHVLVSPADKVDALGRRWPGVTAIAEPAGAGGMYAAINAGWRARSDWDAFTYLNDDDMLLPRFAAALRAVADAHGAERVAYGAVRLIDGRGRRLGAIPVSPAPALNRLLYAQRIEPVYQHGTVVTRAALERLGGFDASLRGCGDTEFLARACLAGVPFVRVRGAAVAAFRLRPGQLTKSRAAMLAERARVDRQLALLAARPTWRHRLARGCFRLANLPAYAERVARSGFVTFDEVLERGG